MRRRDDACGGLYRLHLFVYLADLNGLNALDAENLCDRGGKMERNVKIVQALVDVSRKTCGSILYLINTLDARALKGETRAIIMPMSPLPRMTQRRVGI